MAGGVVMKATEEMHEAARRKALERRLAMVPDWQVTRAAVDAALAAAPQQDLDPSHAALVARVERLEAALDVADDVHAWLELMLPDMSQEDRDYLHPLHIAFRVLSGDAVQPGDLGEGGA